MIVNLIGIIYVSCSASYDVGIKDYFEEIFRTNQATLENSHNKKQKGGN